MHVNKDRGFTLVELVTGIVVLSVALVLFTSLLVPQAQKSVDPIFQVRAAELGQSLITEIATKSFDETSDRTGGELRCNDDGADPCTASDELGNEESDRENFDDVDDYDGLSVSGENIKNALNEDITLNGNPLYSGFSVVVSVVYDDNMNGIDDAVDNGSVYTGNTKLITVTVTTPNGEDIVFSTYRSNF